MRGDVADVKENGKKEIMNGHLIDNIMNFEIQTLPIPDICHGRHGRRRVNFFWPV